MKKTELSELAQYCSRIAADEEGGRTVNEKMGHRLVCPEYSKSVQEIKTYPQSVRERMFALCWDIGQNAVLHAAMYPSLEPSVYRTSFVNGSVTQLHTHDYIELAYVAAGTFRQKILGRDVFFQKGEMCLIDKNCLHQDYLFAESATILFIGIARDMFSEIMDETITTQKIIAFLQSALLEQKDVQQYLHFKPEKDADREMEACLYLLLRELRENKIGAAHICRGLLQRVFRIMSTRYEFYLSKEQKRTMNWIIFGEVSDYIKNHYADVTIRKLMEEFHFQEDYFNRLIKSKTGQTYSAYVQQIRLEQAGKMLTSTDKNVEEIAELAGYHNKGYFYKIFQQKYKMTPSEYRKKNR